MENSRVENTGSDSYFFIKAILLVLSLSLLSSCVVMEQTGKPAAFGAGANGLADTVKLIPITADTLLEIASPLPMNQPAYRLPSSNNSWDYRVGPGDVLNIVVWDHPQLTIPAGPQRSPEEAGNWVGSNGTIFYPYIGSLDVAGKTISEVRVLVADGLRNVIPNPQVDVSVARFSSQTVQITGEVSLPGMVRLTNVPLTLAEAIELRQGLLPDADTRNVVLIRDNQEYRLNFSEFRKSGRREHNPVLRGGDTIVVSKLNDNNVFVLGEVGRPQMVPLRQESVSLTKALTMSEGIDATSADASGVFVFRSITDNQTINVYQLDIRNPVALMLGTRFQLDKGDVVYVTSAPATRWSRLIANLVPSLNTILLLDDRF